MSSIEIIRDWVSRRVEALNMAHFERCSHPLQLHKHTLKQEQRRQLVIEYLDRRIREFDEQIDQADEEYLSFIMRTFPIDT